MAKIAPPTNYGEARGFDISTHEGPTGSFPARLVDVEDSFGVDVPVYGGAIGETTKKDVCQFLFAYTGDDKKTYLVKSWEMSQSASEKSALYKLLRDMTGEPPVFSGDFDYCDLIGNTAQVTVGSKISKKGKTYKFLASVAPLLSELQEKAPKLEDVEIPGGRRVKLMTSEEDAFSIEKEAL